MLHVYERADHRLAPAQLNDAACRPIWLDLLQPSEAEVREVEHALGVSVPTRAEMEEIELSARLYTEDGALFLTMTALAQLDTDTPIKTPITFILKGPALISVRHAEPKPILAYINRALRARGTAHETGEQIMLGLIEALIDRIADALERVGNEIDAVSHEVFKQGKIKANRKTRDLEAVIAQIGHKSELLTILGESLVSMSRLIAYYSAVQDPSDDDRETRHLTRLTQRDAGALAEHARALSSRLDFLLNATLGLINLEQNAIIKIFSVAAVVFLPPTLVASIYGMNFHFMPELSWPFGYPFALGLMVTSAVLPFLYFKNKGWL